MASLEKYTADLEIGYQLAHDFRKTHKPPGNMEIDTSLSKENYFLTPEDHGRTVESCKKYYKALIDNSYIYGKDSDREIVRCLQWAIQAPADLAPEQKSEFFKACYDYMNSIYGEENCISATVHVDEIMVNSKGERISKDHIHYLAVPRVENNRYLSEYDKFMQGLSKLQKTGMLTDPEKIRAAAEIIDRYYEGTVSKNETISLIAKDTGCKYADARKIFTAIARKESESYQMKLNSDALTSRKQLHDFHPGLQQFLDDRGIRCTVSYKSQGISRELSYTVAEAKTVTRITGLSVEKIKSLEIENERLHEKVRTLEKEIVKNKSIERTSEWGNSTGWGDISWDTTRTL